jgi:hypothetical protein
MKTLGGATMIYNGVSQDYSFIETLECLYECCDEIAIIYGGDDGTMDKINKWARSKDWNHKEIGSASISKEEWESQVGREKLSYFSNLAIDMLSSDYVLYLQADEVLHENCFDAVRDAITHDHESIMCTRYNLWASPYMMLDVEQSRKPCSTEVIRLAKTKYRCVGDAESLGGMTQCEIGYLPHIRIYHNGFVRDKHKHIDKIIHMQRDVFQMDYDKRVHDCEDGFDPWKFGFTPDDVVPIIEALPKFMKEWASERRYNPFKITPHGYSMAVIFIKHVVQLDKIPSYVPVSEKVVDIANDIWGKVCDTVSLK